MYGSELAPDLASVSAGGPCPDGASVLVVKIPPGALAARFDRNYGHSER